MAAPAAAAAASRIAARSGKRSGAAQKAQSGLATAADIGIIKQTVAPSKVSLKGTAQQKPIVNVMVIVMGVGALKVWLVDGDKVPPRRWWINIAIMGFVFALLNETAPKVGRPMAYLVMTSVLFVQGKEIIDALQATDRPPSRRGPQGTPVAGLPGSAPNHFTVEAPGRIAGVSRIPASFFRDWPRPHRYRDPQGPRAAVYA